MRFRELYKEKYGDEYLGSPGALSLSKLRTHCVNIARKRRNNKLAKKQSPEQEYEVWKHSVWGIHFARAVAAGKPGDRPPYLTVAAQKAMEEAEQVEEHMPPTEVAARCAATRAHTLPRPTCLRVRFRCFFFFLFFPAPRRPFQTRRPRSAALSQVPDVGNVYLLQAVILTGGAACTFAGKMTLSSRAGRSVAGVRTSSRWRLRLPALPCPTRLQFRQAGQR